MLATPNAQAASPARPAALAAPAALSAPAVRVQALLALCLGLVVVGFVGFSHLDVVHNAAHDTRHANAFPCH